MACAAKSAWGNENRRDSEGKHHTAAGGRTQLIAAKDAQSSVSHHPPKKNHTLHFLRAAAWHRPLLGSNEPDATFAAAGPESHKPQKIKSSEFHDGHLNALMYSLNADAVERACGTMRLGAALQGFSLQSALLINTQQRPRKCAQTFARLPG